MTKDYTYKDITAAAEELLTKRKLDAAAYLRGLATMIETGSIKGFELSWSVLLDKPVGSILMNAEKVAFAGTLNTTKAIEPPIELPSIPEPLTKSKKSGKAGAKEISKALTVRSKVPVTDVSDEKCTIPDCDTCNPKPSNQN